MATKNPQLFYEEGGISQVLEFDVVTVLGWSDNSEATEYPVESGDTSVTDAIRDLPKQITIEGTVTNTPLLENPGGLKDAKLQQVTLDLPKYPKFFPTPGQLVGAAVNAVGNLFNPPKDPSKTQAWIYPKFKDRASAMHGLITRLKADRVKFSFQSPFRSADDLYIIGYEGPETPEDGEAAVFSLTLKQVDAVEVAIVDAPQPAELLGALKKVAGSKSASDDDPERAALKSDAVKKSLAATGYDAAAGKFGSVLKGLGL